MLGRQVSAECETMRAWPATNELFPSARRPTCWPRAAARRTAASSSGTRTPARCSTPLTPARRRGPAPLKLPGAAPSLCNLLQHSSPMVNSCPPLGLPAPCVAQLCGLCRMLTTKGIERQYDARGFQQVNLTHVRCGPAGVRAAVEPARARDPKQPWLQPEPAVPVEVPLHGQGGRDVGPHVARAAPCAVARRHRRLLRRRRRDAALLEVLC